jgi:glycosyltransferase involved in cell wall biosynthesis
MDRSSVRDNVSEPRKRVLVCVPRYLPGYKSGGPTRAVANMIANLGLQFSFYVVTMDRDQGDTERYPGIEADRWTRVGNAQVLYCSAVTSRMLRKAFHDVQPDVIHLNSFQNIFTRAMLLLRRTGEFGKIPVILAPRGEFSVGAMEIKRKKKAVYRKAARLAGLYEDLHWQVSAPPEGRDLLKAAPVRQLHPDSIHVAHEIFDGQVSTAPHPAKNSGSVRLVFIARISEMKNLHFLADCLTHLRGEVEFNIYGPVSESDKAYWERCKASLTKLPANIRAEYHGTLDHAAVPQTLHDHHFFVLPTMGENYCHSAVESIINGTPVVLSNATPWVNLAQFRAGFDIPLADRNGWTTALQSCVEMDQQVYSGYLEGTRTYARQFSIEEAVREHYSMFQTAISHAQ